MTGGDQRSASPAEAAAQFMGELHNEDMPATTRKVIYQAIYCLVLGTQEAKCAVLQLDGEQRRFAARAFQRALTMMARNSETDLELQIARGRL